MRSHDEAKRMDQLIAALERGRITRRQFAQQMLAWGVSFGAIGSLLAACGDDEAADAGGPLQFWKFVSENDDPAIEEAIKSWNRQNPDTQVRFQTFPFEDYTGTKLTTAFAADKGPDIFWVSAGQFLDYVNQGLSTPVDDLVEELSSDYLAASLEEVRVDGGIQSLPFEMEPIALYYRPDLFEEAGVDVPRTWSELIDAAEALTTKKRAGVIVETAPLPYQVFVWYPFLWSAGGEVITEDSSAPALRTPEAASAFQLWGDLVSRGVAPKELGEVSADIGPLGRGETAMQVCGFWGIAQMRSGFPDVEYGVAPIPIPEGGEPATVYGGWTQMINSQSPRIEAAKEFTKWLWIENEDFSHTWACGQNTKFSPRNSVNEGCAEVFEASPQDVFVNEILPTARPQPRYPEQVVQAVGDGIQAAMFRGASGEDAAALAAERIERFLSTYKGAPLTSE